METNLLLLPTEIALDIFSRLPAESVLRCRRVCKTLRNLLQLDTKFADMHLRRQFRQLGHDDHNNYNNGGGAAAKVGLGVLFLLMTENTSVGGYPLYYGEFDENNSIGDDQKYTHMTLTRINHPPFKKRIKRLPTELLVGSCNGLICFSEPQGYSVADPVHICNPITGECADLPRLNNHIEYKLIDRVICGFGYLPSTNEYKVVRIYYCCKERLKGHVQVYTLGSDNGWRNKGETTYWLRRLPGILSNGALHWLTNHNREWKIVAFDLADEKFHVVPSPTCFSRVLEFDLLVLEGRLCFVSRAESLDIWLLKKTKNKKTTTTYNITERNEYESWSWIKEFTIARELRNCRNFKPFGLTKSGEVLLRSNTAILFRYDPKTETLKQLVDMKFLEVIPHMNSFVSMEALGEKCRKRRRCMRR